MNYHIELFHSLLNQFLSDEEALLTLDGRILGLKGVRPDSFGTLATAATTAQHYLKLKNGDIALVNDPYSGGNLLSEMTFVTALPEGLLWVRRQKTQHKISRGSSIEQEGLRIPPTPIRNNNQMNMAIIDAMAAHPLCPKEFKDWIISQTNEILESSKNLTAAFNVAGFQISEKLIQDYLNLSKESANKSITERASGESRVDVVLDSGELLRLNLEIHDGKITLDFTGSSPSKSVTLTESATYGTCASTISRFYQLHDLANSGTLSIIQVRKPSGCWLTGKYPAATFKGMICGTAAITTAIELALNHIHSNKEAGLNSHCPLAVEITSQGKSEYFELKGGSGASSSGNGSFSKFSEFSIEQLESSLPLQVIRADHRQSLGGKGKMTGGRGLIFKLAMKDEVQVQWLTDLTQHKPKLTKNCSHGDSNEITLEQSGELTELPPEGFQNLSKGDLLTLCTGSGGGYGREVNSN